MKPNAFTKYKYSAEHYKIITKTIGESLVNEYYYVGNVAIRAGSPVNGKLILFCSEPIAMGNLIKDIKDSNGELILGDQIWQISGLQPTVNAFNNIEEYRMQTIKFQGSII